MRGALKARREESETRRDLALMTAYFAGQLSQADWSKMAPFPDWLARLTVPQRISPAERIAAFEALSRHGFAVTVSTRTH